MSERSAVLEANRAFYDAFQSLSAEQMAAVWLKDQRIVCIHPGWPKLAGWGPVMASWERIFDNVFEMKFEIELVEAHLSGDLAVLIVEERLAQRGYDGAMSTRVLATNVFERVGNRWWMVLHHGSAVLAPPSEEPMLQ